MKNKFTLFGLIILAVVAFTGCADVSHVQTCLAAGEHTYGFWGGTWHGMIMGPSFIGSLFSDDIAIYAINNNGAWYNFGYVGGFWTMLKLVSYAIKGVRGK